MLEAGLDRDRATALVDEFDAFACPDDPADRVKSRAADGSSQALGEPRDH